jgi:DNA-binding CsgD family transcriptional regulator
MATGNPGGLGRREEQIAALLLQGCSNTEIARELKMKPRTVKAHFNRLFERFEIKDGVKRVKLATLLYRRSTATETLASSDHAGEPALAIKTNSTVLAGHLAKSQLARPAIFETGKPSLTRGA